MVRSNWLAVGVAAFAMAAAGIGAFVSAQTREGVAEAPCVNCDRQDIPVKLLPDGTLHTVAQVFDGELPAPDERLRQFSKYIDGQPVVKCVGWSVKVVSVTANENGWEATVHVRPELASEKGGPVFTHAHTVEKWQIAADGPATVLDVREGNGFNGFKGVILRRQE